MKAVRTHIKQDWILLYIERWLVAPFEAEGGVRVPRERGTPQGGVVSPILMNLFMHYAFDTWMQRTSPNCPFARYADDAVVHCRSRKQAEYVMRSIASRSINRTGTSTSCSGTGTRVAVTTICSSGRAGSAGSACGVSAVALAAMKTNRRTNIRHPMHARRARIAGQPRDGMGRASAHGRGSRPLAHREAGLVRQAGLRALEWTSQVPPASPSRALRSGCRVLRPMRARLDYRCGGSAGF